MAAAAAAAFAAAAPGLLLVDVETSVAAVAAFGICVAAARRMSLRELRLLLPVNKKREKREKRMESVREARSFVSKNPKGEN